MGVVGTPVRAGLASVASPLKLAEVKYVEAAAAAVKYGDSAAVTEAVVASGAIAVAMEDATLDVEARLTVAVVMTALTKDVLAT